MNFLMEIVKEYLTAFVAIMLILFAIGICSFAMFHVSALIGIDCSTLIKIAAIVSFVISLISAAFSRKED